MRHPDADDLALFAVSHGPDLADQTEVSEHLDDCADCRAEVDAFRDVAGLVRDDDPADVPAAGDHVWGAIADVLWPGGVGAPSGPLRTAVAADRIPVPVDPAPVATGPAPAAPPVDELADRRRRRSRWTHAAAALVVGAALGAGAVAVTRTDDQPDPTQVEATAALEPIPGTPAPPSEAGRAELLAVDGAQRVVVDVPRLPAIDGAYEVWLFGADGRMVSLGALQGGRGDFTVPQGIDTTEYRTVDVSDEPADGNPTHSGVSVVRGTFS